MNSKHTSAGVYTHVRDFSLRAIALSSAIYGAVGESSRGSINKRVPVMDDVDYTTKFGKRHPKYGFLGYVVDPIAKYSNQGYVVRIVNGAKHAVASLTVDSVNSKVPKLNLAKYVDEQGKAKGVVDVEEIGFLPTDPTNKNILGYFRAENPGAWNNGLSISVQSAAPKGIDAVVGRDNGLYDSKTFIVKVWENYNMLATPDETHTCCFNHKLDEFNTQLFICDVLERGSNLIRFVKNEYFEADIDFVTSAFTYMEGGEDGERCTEDQYAQAYKDHFSDSESLRINMLLDTYGNYIVHRAIIATAEKHVNCHGLLWCHNQYKSVAQIVNYRKNTLNVSTRHASLYTGAVRIFDTHIKRQLIVPCIGFVGAIYADVDNRMGSWFAYAGIDASASLNILGLETVHDQEDRNALTLAQVNYIRKLPAGAGADYALWEQNTLYSLPSAFRNVHVQRMVGYVLDMSQRLCRAGLFDPNNGVLRNTIKTWVEDILNTVRDGGGLRTLNGSNGYQVICDDNNNNSQTIAAGDLVLDMVLDPANTVRRLHIRWNLNPKGSRSTDLSA